MAAVEALVRKGDLIGLNGKAIGQDKGARDWISGVRDNCLIQASADRQFCNSLDQSANALENRNVFQWRVSGV